MAARRWTAGGIATCCVLVCAGCASGPAPSFEGPLPVVLATQLGTVTALAIGDGTVYALSGPSESGTLRSVPLAGGSPTTLVSGIRGATSLAPFGGFCVYCDAAEGNAYRAAPGETPVLVSKGFQGEVGPWVCASGNTLFYARADGKAIASVGLEVGNGGEDEPVAPPQFLRVLGAAEQPELLAANDSYVLFAQKARGEVARMPRQGGAAVAVNSVLGAVTDIDAAGTHAIASGTGGVIADGRTLSSRSGVVAVAVAGERLFYATPSVVYEGTAAGEAPVAEGNGIRQLAGCSSALVFADQASGGRIVRLDLVGLMAAR